MRCFRNRKAGTCTILESIHLNQSYGPSQGDRPMKDVKFICPSCGQHVQCDCSHAGENIPCPSCATLIRVPTGGGVIDTPAPEPGSNPFAAPVLGDSETVSYVPTKPADPAEADKALHESNTPSIHQS